MATYDLGLDTAFWEFPAAVALVLMPVYSERKTGETSGPNFAQDAAIEARNRCRNFLTENFTLIDDPSLPWQLG